MRRVGARALIGGLSMDGEGAVFWPDRDNLKAVWLCRRSHFDDRHRPRPARGGALDLHRKARDREARRRQRVEMAQFFQMAIADVTSPFVALPDQRLVTRRRLFLR